MLKGTSLEDLLRQRKRLPVSQAMRIGREMAEGLAAAHAAGLIHRDIKPGNVWLREEQVGEPVGSDPAVWPVVLLDFGLARAAALGRPLTQTGGVVGTPAYMAPEQAAGAEVDSRADLFSLGCVLYRMLTGCRPFAGNDLMAVLRSVALDQPAPPHEVDPAIPAALSALAMRLLAKEADQRPGSAAPVVAELRALESDPGEPAPPPRQTEPPRRPRWLLPAAVGLGVLVLVGVAWGLVGVGRGLSPGASPGVSSHAEPQSAALSISTFRVTHILVDHEGKKSRKRRGLFGEKSFGAWVGDGVQVEVEFSEPAYAYLLVYNPNPQSDKREEAWPESVLTNPARPGKRLEFPSEGESHYGLSDGPGLEVFVVVASRSPLPAYTDWVKQRGEVGWERVDSTRDVVWLGEDRKLREVLAPEDPRGQVVVPKESGLLRQLLHRLESAPGVEATALVAFTVEPRP
jgi:serine/threonine protein kinase